MEKSVVRRGNIMLVDNAATLGQPLMAFQAVVQAGVRYSMMGFGVFQLQLAARLMGARETCFRWLLIVSRSLVLGSPVCKIVVSMRNNSK